MTGGERLVWAAAFAAAYERIGPRINNSAADEAARDASWVVECLRDVKASTSNEYLDVTAAAFVRQMRRS
jgi:hypothetical protein